MSTETTVNWQDYVAIVIRRRWFFIVPCAAIVAGAMVVGFLTPKQYKSETTLLMQDPKIMNPLMRGMAVASPVEQRMRVVQQELLGWTSISRLVHELGLDRGVNSPLAYERVIKTLRSNIKVSMRGGSLVSLTYMNENPEMAQRVLNTVTNIYIQRNVESQSAEAETAIRFIESELTVYKTKLEDSERALREFKELNAMEMPVAMRLNSDIISLEVQLATLLVENTEEHPTIIQIRRRIQELKQTRNEEIRKVITLTLAKSQSPEIYQDLAEALDRPADPSKPLAPEVQAAKEAYQGWVNRLDSPAMGGDQRQVVEVTAPEAGEDGQPINVVTEGGGLSLTLAPRQEQELSRLRRDYEIHRKTYQEMKQRLERARITQRLGESDEGTKIKIIEPARLPLRPSSPKLWVIFYTALAIGLGAGICAAFAVEYLDQSFQSPEEVQAALAVPVIGSISTIVTEGDVRARQQRRQSWVSYKDQAKRVRTQILRPLWDRLTAPLPGGNDKTSKRAPDGMRIPLVSPLASWIDKALLRWGL